MEAGSSVLLSSQRRLAITPRWVSSLSTRGHHSPY